MHISMNLVMILVSLLVIVPVVLFVLADKSGMSKNKKTFDAVAKANNVQFTTQDIWNNTCLGHQEHGNILLYINTQNPEPKIQKINLDEVRKCSITKITKDYTNGDKQYSELSRLDLEFSFISNRQPEVLTLFNAEDNFSQNQEQARAEKWLAFIEKQRNSKSKNVAA
ncbi:hypothetical protein ES711_08820 [Gelidibacter salicanalis]|uniref:Uncharacterized protein n=1 Tax=Gelidibacter salicanalis TaxID=291193 RepID=A0A5C7AL07_9FLAO|nr:hypothetical protein [Gelidibacter salicanalis]TXE08594.1 hypothetical protein ES711_08820 [Gelidibacter salicanalis]